MFVLAMHAPEIAGAVRAGQFVNLGWSPGPLLRRPFSIYGSEGEHIEVVLKAVGAGTSELLAMKVGDRISCLGPLGHGFDLTGAATTGRARKVRCTAPRKSIGAHCRRTSRMRWAHDC